MMEDAIAAPIARCGLDPINFSESLSASADNAETFARPMHTRREFGALVGGATLVATASSIAKAEMTPHPRVMIAAPTNLGLPPLRANHIPGAWRAPEALEAAGLAKALGANRSIRLERPKYSIDAPLGSRIRNGPELRLFNERLSREVAATIAQGAFPIVVGGDCSILLGCLAGVRQLGAFGLIHVDGHSDFYHPGNYDAEARLGSAAGMDLALATGRGEPLLELWDGMPLVEDRDVSQIGERDEVDPDYDYRDIEASQIRRFPVRQVQASGVERIVQTVLAPVEGRELPLWLHVDLDVLDGTLMPAVDSPGSPGLSFDELSELLERFLASGRIIGLDLTIYDPDLDPEGWHAREIVGCFGRAFAAWRT